MKATEVTKAEQEREVACLAAEKAEFDKKRIVVEGQVEAEVNRLKVAAGVTPSRETGMGIQDKGWCSRSSVKDQMAYYCDERKSGWRIQCDGCDCPKADD